MKYSFEIYILHEQLSTQHWKQLYSALLSHIGLLNKFEIVFTSANNVIRFFVRSDKDLGALSNKLDGMLLRPVAHETCKQPKLAKKTYGVQFVSGGNLLDLKEKYSIKRSMDLDYASFSIRGVSSAKAVVTADFFFVHRDGSWVRSRKIMGFLPTGLLAIDFANNAKYLHREVPRYLNIEKSLHMVSSDPQGAIFQVDTFPYFPKDYYLNLSGYDFDKHSFIIGASGSGKSKLISLLIDRLSRTSLRMNYRVIVIDPHAALAEDLGYIADSRIVTFGVQDGTNLFPGAGTDLTAATELTATLFKSVLADQFNARVDRLLRYSLFILMTAQTMTLDNLKRFLTDIEFRNQVTKHVEGYVPANVTKFFGADFNEFRTQYYEVTILPLVSMIDEMQLQPSLVGESQNSLARIVQENFLTVFSLNKVSMGEKVVKTVAGLLIQQIFLLAQARAFGQKVILIVDEVSVVQNPALAQILAEARKFNLTVILTQQYFGQVEKELSNAIFSNVYNYYTFKVSEEDARALEGNLNIELPKSLLETEQAKGLSPTDIKVKLMTELHPRECLVRVLSNGQIVPCIKARTVDAPRDLSATAAPRLVPSTQSLPEKFIEQTTADKPRSITFSPEFTHMLAERQPSEPTPQESIYPLQGLHDLLASHSSSRINVKKKD